MGRIRLVLAVFSLFAVWPVWQFQGQASSTLLIVLVLIFNLTFSKHWSLKLHPQHITAV